MSEWRAEEPVEGIAIVGMAGRFPGAPDLDTFWRNLRAGVESISFFSDEELRAAGVDAAYLEEPNYVRAAGVLDDVDRFDAPFFGFNASDAEVLDPQIRFFLQATHHALESAGCDPRRFDGLIGLYGGMYPGQYAIRNLLPNRELLRQTGDLRLRIYSDKDFLASLTAYKLDLRGPCLTVQSACSTSLVAVALACQSLVGYQCDLALAGGVCVPLPAKTGYFAHEGVFSRDGHCRAFDHRATGTALGSGVGMVVLKRLEEALDDGDRVRAVIRGWAVNNDGSFKAGYTAPSLEGQAEVIAMAQAMAGVEAETITYVEAHGTGTPLGDSVEIAALRRVFSESTEKRGFCAVGSVKTNLGHLDAAAGIASLIKTTLALEHGEIPPTVHFEAPNPEIDFASSPFYVSDRLHPWERGAVPRRAGVSSFAVGGVNAHLVLEEAPAPEPSGPSRPWQLLVLSARTPEALEAASDRLARRLEEAAADELGDAWLADAAHTLRFGRRQAEERRILVCRNAADAAQALAARDPHRLLSAEAPSRREVAFLFPGLGNHYVGMGAELYRCEEVYRRQVDRCAEVLEPLLGLDLRRLLAEIPDPGELSGLDLRRMVRGEGEGAGELIETRLAQPAVFTLELALARLWQSWGVHPKAMLGHSVGEYVAACLAGVFELEDALTLVAERARMIDGLEKGVMLAVGAGEAEVAGWLREDDLGELSMAAVNAPESTVVAGPEPAAARFEAALAGRGVSSRRAQTSHAFHSAMLRPLAEAYAGRVSEVARAEPKVPFVSGVSGRWITAEQACDPLYWAEHMCAPVRFADGVATLAADGEPLLLEVGPGQALSAWALQAAALDEGTERLALASLRYTWDEQSDQAFLLQTLGRLWLAGAEVDWAAFARGERRHKVELPGYPFERRRYWVDPPDDTGGARPEIPRPAAQDLAGRLERWANLAEWLAVPLWRQTQAPPAPVADSLADRWLVLADDGGVGNALAHRLEALGRRVEVVRAGELAGAAAWGELLDRLGAGAGLPQEVVHLWSLGAPSPELVALGEVERAEAHQELGFWSLLALVRAFGERLAGAEARLTVVSSGLFAVTGEEVLEPARATLLGPSRVMAQEVPGLACRNVDVSPPAAGSAADLHQGLVEALLAEIAAGPGPVEEIVAYRGGRRWIRGFESSLLEAGEKGESVFLRPRGTYLVTGGLGGVGLVFAERLARSVQARLVLIGRSADRPPPEVGAKLRELEAAGAELLVLRADVTDRGDLRAVAGATRERFGRLDGVIHAAGVYPGGLIRTKSRESAAAVLAPKLRGTLQLAEEMASLEPDFMLLCSSLTAYLGGFGLADHVAANAFLAAFAHSRVGTPGPRMLAVAWDTWLEIGQAARSARERDLAAAGSPAAGLPAEAERCPLDHPFLDVVYETGARALLDPVRHWVLDEHRVGERGLLPGTAYLEMAHTAFRSTVGAAAELAETPVAIERLLFERPLVAESAREVVLHLEPRASEESVWSLRFESRPATGGAWQEHARASLSPSREAVAGRQDLDALVNGLREAKEALAGPVTQGFHFGPRWHDLVRRLWLGDGELVAHLELADEHATDLEKLDLHPALLDTATGLVQLLADGRYLPFGYERVTVFAPLPKRLVSHVRLAGSAGVDGLACDVTIYGPGGDERVRVEGYTLKRLASQQAAELAAPAAGAGSPERLRRAALTEGISPAEGAEVFERLLTRWPSVPEVLVASRDVEALLEAARSTSHDEILLDAAELRGRQRHRRSVQVAYEAPRNDLEADLCRLCQGLLGVEKVGVHDPFFDIGGDSLTATQLLGEIRSAHDVEIPLRDLFAAPTVAELAMHVLQEQAAAQSDEALDAAFDDLEGLTEEELEALIEAEKQAQENR